MKEFKIILDNNNEANIAFLKLKEKDRLLIQAFIDENNLFDVLNEFYKEVGGQLLDYIGKK